MIDAAEIAKIATVMRNERILHLAAVDGQQKLELHLAPDAFEDSLLAMTADKIPTKPKGGCPTCSDPFGRLLPPLCDSCARKACLSG